MCLKRVEIRKKNSSGFCLVRDRCAKAWVVARSLLIAKSESSSSNSVTFEKETNPLVLDGGQVFMEFLSRVGWKQSLEGCSSPRAAGFMLTSK